MNWFPFDDSAVPIAPVEECVPVFIMLDTVYTEEPDEFGSGSSQQRVRVFNPVTGVFTAEAAEAVEYQGAIGIDGGVVFYSPNTSSYDRVDVRGTDATQVWAVDFNSETPALNFNPLQGGEAIGRNEDGRLLGIMFDTTGNPGHGGLPNPPTFLVRRFDAEGVADSQATLNNAWLPANPFEYNNIGVSFGVRENVLAVPWLMYENDMDAYYNLRLLGIRRSNGNVAWNVVLQDEIGLVWADFRSEFGGDEHVFVAGTWGPYEGTDALYLVRLDFPDGVLDPPTVTWTETPALNPGLLGLEVTSDRVIVMGDTSTGSAVIAYDHDGNVEWSKAYADGETIKHLACDGETVCLAIQAMDGFDKVVGAQRYEFFAVSDGAERSYSPVSAGGFGLSWVGPVASSVCVEDAPVIIV